MGIILEQYKDAFNSADGFDPYSYAEGEDEDSYDNFTDAYNYAEGEDDFENANGKAKDKILNALHNISAKAKGLKGKISGLGGGSDSSNSSQSDVTPASLKTPDLSSTPNSHIVRNVLIGVGVLAVGTGLFFAFRKKK